MYKVFWEGSWPKKKRIYHDGSFPTRRKARHWCVRREFLYKGITIEHPDGTLEAVTRTTNHKGRATNDHEQAVHRT